MFKKYEGRKAAVFLAAVFSVFVVFFLGLLFFMNQRVKVIDVSDCERDDTGRITYAIEEVGDFYNFISVTGYAYEAGQSIERASIKIVARDTDTDTYYELPTENVKRTELTNTVGDGNNYDYAGFKSIAYRDKLPQNLELCILYRCNGSNILIHTSNQ